jgi:hypothetical protein
MSAYHEHTRLRCDPWSPRPHACSQRAPIVCPVDNKEPQISSKTSLPAAHHSEWHADTVCHWLALQAWCDSSVWSRAVVSQQPPKSGSLHYPGVEQNQAQINRTQVMACGKPSLILGARMVDFCMGRHTNFPAPVRSVHTFSDRRSHGTFISASMPAYSQSGEFMSGFPSQRVLCAQRVQPGHIFA